MTEYKTSTQNKRRDVISLNQPRDMSAKMAANGIRTQLFAITALIHLIEHRFDSCSPFREITKSAWGLPQIFHQWVAQFS